MPEHTTILLSPLARLLEEKLRARTAHVGIIGLGYVGLPLAMAFAQAGVRVTGVDVDASKCARLNAGESTVEDVSSASLATALAAGRFRATADYAALSECDVTIICVPTPLSKSKSPDISYILAAAEGLAPQVHEGMLVVLESTTYPGTTEEVLLPRLAARGFRPGEEVFLAYSPERVDPGNRRYHIGNTPKVVAGLTPTCRALAEALYGLIVERVVPVSSLAAAEMCKILENTFRAVNIGLVNEMAQICHRLGLDVWEVIAAASTKPFGFMPFYPGPGLGGHCIPIDPLYLTWKMRTLGMQTRFIELADVINGEMPHYVVNRLQDALNERGCPLKGTHILILGVAYKRDVGDVRESPALPIIAALRARHALVAYHDPYVPTLTLEDGECLSSIALTAKALEKADAVLIHTDHTAYDWPWIAQHARLIFDTRNALAGIPAKGKVVRL